MCGGGEEGGHIVSHKEYLPLCRVDIHAVLHCEWHFFGWSMSDSCRGESSCSSFFTASIMLYVVKNWKIYISLREDMCAPRSSLSYPPWIYSCSWLPSLQLLGFPLKIFIWSASPKLKFITKLFIQNISFFL